MGIDAGDRVPIRKANGTWDGDASIPELAAALGAGSDVTFRGAYDEAVQYLPGDLVVMDFMGFPFSVLAVLPSLGLDPIADIIGDAPRHWFPIGKPADVWDGATTYDLNIGTIGSDGRMYTSIQAANQGHDPVTDLSGDWWMPAHYTPWLGGLGTWDEHITYQPGNIVKGDDDLPYVALTPNVGANPMLSANQWSCVGSVNWAHYMVTASQLDSSDFGTNLQLFLRDHANGAAGCMIGAPVDITPGGHFGYLSISPAFAIPEGGTLTFDILVAIWNADYSERLYCKKLALPAADVLNFDYTGATITKQVGSDLSIDSGHVKSTAGGTFQVGHTIYMTPTGIPKGT